MIKKTIELDPRVKSTLIQYTLEEGTAPSIGVIRIVDKSAGLKVDERYEPGTYFTAATSTTMWHICRVNDDGSNSRMWALLFSQKGLHIERYNPAAPRLTIMAYVVVPGEPVFV